MVEPTDTQKRIDELIRDIGLAQVIESNFYGTIEIQFKCGEPTVIKKTATIVASAAKRRDEMSTARANSEPQRHGRR